MKQNIIEMIQELLVKRAKNKLLRKFVFTLAVFVVFCTTYALILPAISIDKETTVMMPGIDMQSNASVASTEPEITEDSPIENTETSTEAVASSTENTEEKQNLDGVYEKAQEDYSVSVTVPEKAEIPSESELYLEPVSDDDSAYLKKVKSLFKGERIKKAVFFDMGFANEGQDQKPQSAVNVTLQMKDKINGKLVHFTEDDVEIVNAEIKHLKPTKNTEEDFQTNISFATDSFSVYGIVETTLEDSILTSDGKNYKISV